MDGAKIDYSEGGVYGETHDFVKIVLPSRRNTNLSGLARYMLIHVGPMQLCWPVLTQLESKLLHVASCWPQICTSWPQVAPKLTPSWLMLAQLGPNLVLSRGVLSGEASHARRVMVLVPPGRARSRCFRMILGSLH